MYQQAEWPPLDTFPSYLEVAMVTVGGLVTCSVIVMACTFCPFLRKFKPDRTDGRSDMPPGHYVEEFYANPAFMELPFDGSNTNPSDLPYYEPTLTLDINHQTNMEKTTSISSTTNHTIIPPKTVVTTVTGPAPYQMEPKYYVQSNACISSTSDDIGNSAIKGAANNNSSISKDDGAEEDVEAKNTNGLRLTESLSTDVVYANQGAAESFREQKQVDDDVSKSIENLGTVKAVTNLLPHNGDDRVLNSPKGGANKDQGVPTTKGDDGTGQNYLFSWESRAKGEKVLQDDGQEKSGTWNKRVRQSFDDLYMAGRNGPSQQQPVKKLKVTGSDVSNSDAKHISRTGSRAKRKIRNSFSKVQKPIFRPRRKTIDTRPSTEIIQNPFVV